MRSSGMHPNLNTGIASFRLHASDRGGRHNAPAVLRTAIAGPARLVDLLELENLRVELAA